MKPEDIAKLRTYCEDFRKYRDNTVDGNGNNLHDIKQSFDYVKKTLDEYQISSTKYGTDLSTKAETASNILSQLWLCYQNLEKSIEGFCEMQERNNNRVQ